MTKISTVLAILVLLLGWALRAGPLSSDYVQMGPYKAVVVETVKNAPFVVYLHGYGGSGNDVFEADFKKIIQKNPELQKMNWIFPDAPGGSWFNMLGAELDVKQWDEGLKLARRNLRAMLKAAGVDAGNVIWAGFSQGAITAADFVLHANQRPLGLIIDSGIYYKSVNNANVLKGLSFQMIHDQNDDILPFENAQTLAKTLRDTNGMIGKIQSTSTGHTVHNSFVVKSLKQIQSMRSGSACLSFYKP